jgi:hypothetical protein
MGSFSAGLVVSRCHAGVAARCYRRRVAATAAVRSLAHPQARFPPPDVDVDSA